MMSAMSPGGLAHIELVAFLHRPTSGAITWMVVLALIGLAAHWVAEWVSRPPRPEAGASSRPAPLAADGNGIPLAHRVEPPAVVGVLTNDYAVPQSAAVATVLDLAARGWVRIAAVDGDVVIVTRGAPADGDTLRPFEQQVINHLRSRSFNDVTSASTLGASYRRLDRRWWWRFRRSAAATAQRLGLTTRRYGATHLVVPAACAFLGLLTAWRSAREGDEIALEDSWWPRAWWLAATAVLVGVAAIAIARWLGSAQRPTALGRERATAWFGFRRRLAERIPDHASVIAPAAQTEALAQATVMGVAPHVARQLSFYPEDARHAWSDAGGMPHTVRVRYPMFPGYGQHPLKIAAVGLVAWLIARWVRGQLLEIADGDSLTDLIERVPGEADIVETIARWLAVLLWVPIVWGVIVLVAGLIDSVATRERTGAVVRARRPSEVVPARLLHLVRPLGDRDRYSTYVAIDDGERRTVIAWLASERTAAPEGTYARVRTTWLLGHIKEAEPVGTATRSDGEQHSTR